MELISLFLLNFLSTNLYTHYYPNTFLGFKKPGLWCFNLLYYSILRCVNYTISIICINNNFFTQKHNYNTEYASGSYTFFSAFYQSGLSALAIHN